MLVLEKVFKYFNKGTINEVLAINNLDLIVERADFITIIGSNGAGKSTMLSCMAGTIMPDSGRLVLGDKDVSKWPEWKRARYIGRVFQDPLKGTSASLSIEENLSMALRRGKRRGFGPGVTAADRDLFRDRLKELGLGLEDRLKDQVGLLSGGQRQALTLLMATMVKPEVLLLDEHTAALDPKTAQQILELTQQIVETQKLTTLMVTHNMRQAIALGNRLVMLHGGEVILDLEGDAKKNLTVDELLQQFYTIKGEAMSSDRLLLG